MTVNGSLITIYTTYVTGAMTAFMPLISSVIGVFLAFAIANLVRNFIIKTAK
ncbi:MAG: hypothetical protein AAB649_03565 [Patescibacteria group bacterium]